MAGVTLTHTERRYLLAAGWRTDRRRNGRHTRVALRLACDALDEIVRAADTASGVRDELPASWSGRVAALLQAVAKARLPRSVAP